MFRRVLREEVPQLHLYITAFIATCIFAIVSEIIQILSPHRSPEFIDLARDMLGAACSLMYFAAFDNKDAQRQSKQRRSNRVILFITASIILLAGFYPLFQVTNAYIQRDKAFPLLMTFNDQWAQSFLSVRGGILEQPRRPDSWPMDNIKKTGEFRIDLSTDWPFLRLDEVYANWARYNTLVIDIFSTAKVKLPVTILIDDKHTSNNHPHSQRYNESILPGFNQLRLPLHHPTDQTPNKPTLDLANIRRIWLAFPEPQKAVTLHFGEMALVE